jgi:hypothetical protein
MLHESIIIHAFQRGRLEKYLSLPFLRFHLQRSSGGVCVLLRQSYVANTPTRRFYADADLAYLAYLTREPPLRKPATRPLSVAAVSVSAPPRPLRTDFSPSGGYSCAGPLPCACYTSCCRLGYPGCSVANRASRFRYHVLQFAHFLRSIFCSDNCFAISSPWSVRSVVLLGLQSPVPVGCCQQGALPADHHPKIASPVARGP